jgi:ribonuclease VapC
MVIDTSALVAIFMGEPERMLFLGPILQAETKLISAANSLETGIVLEAKRGEAAGREFDLFIVRAKLEVVSVDAEQTEIARSAWRKYGKGRHAASLNFGDCFAYALAKFSGEKLLAKDEDFRLTDVELAVRTKT